MTFFMGSIALGLAMVDWFTSQWEDMSGEEPDPPPRQERLNVSRFRHELDGAPAGHRLVFLIIGVISLAILLLLTLGANLVLDWMAAIIEIAYEADPRSTLGAFFTRLAAVISIGSIPSIVIKRPHVRRFIRLGNFKISTLIRTTLKRPPIISTGV